MSMFPKLLRRLEVAQAEIQRHRRDYSCSLGLLETQDLEGVKATKLIEEMIYTCDLLSKEIVKMEKTVLHRQSERDLN